MSYYCPNWIFDVLTGAVASEYLEKEIPLLSISKKYTNGISKVYKNVEPVELYAVAEDMLQLLHNLNAAEEANDFIKGYCFYKLRFVGPNSPRKIKTFFIDALQGDKEKKYSYDKSKKSFKSYIFSLRSGLLNLADPGWELFLDESIPFLSEIARKPVEISDLV